MLRNKLYRGTLESTVPRHRRQNRAAFHGTRAAGEPHLRAVIRAHQTDGVPGFIRALATCNMRTDGTVATVQSVAERKGEV